MIQPYLIITKIANLFDLSNGENLKTLAEDSRSESNAMRQLSEKGFRDAVAVKVLTIVTLVYLPTTVVAVSASPPFCNVAS